MSQNELTAGDLMSFTVATQTVQRYIPQTSNIRCTKSQTLKVSCLVLQLPLPNSLKPDVKSRMKM